jgi:hypothetical protein
LRKRPDDLAPDLALLGAAEMHVVWPDGVEEPLTALAADSTPKSPTA